MKQAPQVLKDVVEIVQTLVKLEREAAEVRAQPAFQPTNAHPRTLDQIIDQHHALLYDYAKVAIRAALKGEDVAALLTTPGSMEPLTNARQRMSAAIQNQIAAWAAAGETPAPHDAPKYAQALKIEA